SLVGVVAGLCSLRLDAAPALRDPPSFPTRRSSDLSGGVAALLKKVKVKHVHGWATFRDGKTVSVGTETGQQVIRAETVVIATGRSEEHTSELQSRENLVCRLLLEKKNVTAAVTANR